jgi:G8 domain/Right handed beta helix region
MTIDSARGCVAFTLFLYGWASAADSPHLHSMAASGGMLPHGIPRLCAHPSVTSAHSGAWSNASTWSNGKVPREGAAVLIGAGTVVNYDVASQALMQCVDVEGSLRFSTRQNTLLKVVTMTVLDTGTLQIGTAAAAVPARIKAEIVIADQPVDLTRDPEQFGVGIIGLGKIVIAGAAKSPTFARLAAEPLHGESKLTLAESVSGWRVGDKLVLPDTRQLLVEESRDKYRPQWEAVRVASIADRTITLDKPLEFDHHGARDGAGKLIFLPHVGNATRNVIVRSENPKGTRGHLIFVGRADIDIRYALFLGLGRTRLGVLDNVAYGADGRAIHIGDNQIGRYSLHFHHLAGPLHAQKNGYQFTLIGNAVDDASKWGITVHDSHYGLVRDNVVYDSRGAGIVTEDGTESFNVFAHNFALRSQGSGEFAPASGYSGAAADPGGEGAGFWFRGPNNYIRDNVAANVEVFGFGIAAGALGEVRIPKFQGADTSQDGQFVLRDTTDMPVLEFANNEAYGAIQTGVAIGWNATLKDSRLWHTTLNAVTALADDWLNVERITILGDPKDLANEFENPTGIWFGDYGSKKILVQNADIQGMRVGVESPFFLSAHREPGRGNSQAIIENSYLRDYVGIAIGTGHVDADSSITAKRAIVRDTRFDELAAVAPGRYAPAAISMNYGSSADDVTPRTPIEVRGFNARAQDDFSVYYSNFSNAAPAAAAPCDKTRPQIGGYVCAGTPN